MLGAGSRRRADPPPRARADTCARRYLLCSAYRPRVHVAQTPKIAAWLRARNMTEDDGYAYFVSRAAKIAIAQGRRPVQWSEVRAKAADISPRYLILVRGVRAKSVVGVRARQCSPRGGVV